MNKSKLITLFLSCVMVVGCKTKTVSDEDNYDGSSIPFIENDPFIKGTYKIGVIGEDLSVAGKGYLVREAIKQITQDVENSARTGKLFYYLPPQLILQRSPIGYEVDISASPYYGESTKTLQKNLYSISVENEKADINFANNKKMISLPLHGKKDLFGPIGKPSPFVKYLFLNLENNKTLTIKNLYVMFIKTLLLAKQYNSELKIWNLVGGAHDTLISGATKSSDHEIKFASLSSLSNVDLLSTTKTYKELSEKSNIKSIVNDYGLKLYQKNLDTLFLILPKGIINNEDIYKNVIEKNKFQNTNVFLIGKNSHYKLGDETKLFAAGNVSTSTFNEYAAAYTTGFQSAVSQIEYNKEENEYEKTSISFFIGSTNTTKNKKKAYAFKNGVIAATKHPKYQQYLDVKFVDKNDDNSNTNKKISYDVPSWIQDNKISNFVNSDNFQNGDNKVVYLAGTSIENWTGSTVGGATNNNFEKGDNKGLIGAIYKYNDSGETNKSFGKRGIKIILDQNQNLSKIGQKWTPTNKTDKDSLEREQIKLLGFIGGESAGNFTYTSKAINALYLNQEKYMLGKHTIFGSQMDLKTYNTIDNFAYFNEKLFWESVLNSFDYELKEDVITQNN